MLFWPMATASVIFSLAVVLAKSPVRSALALVGVMSLLAVFFAFLQAHLLFLFVITLLNLESDHGVREKPKLTAIGFGAGAVVAAGLAFALAGIVAPAARHGDLPDGFGTTVMLAHQMFSRYLVAFELTSVLLLVAVVGAVVLAKRTAEENAEEVTGA
jgi:NADH-quinone oxidoreductase subunit J